MHAFRMVGIVGAVATLLLSTSVVFAQESGADRAVNVPVRAQVEIEKAVQAHTQATAASTARAAIEKNEQLRVKAMNATTAGERVQAVREGAQERAKVEREKANERMKDIKNEKRQENMQKFATRLENLNERWTNRFAEQLDRLSAVVKKMESRAATAAANGKEVTAANAAIGVAKNVIQTAQAGVAAQTAKTYTLDLLTVTTSVATSTSKGQRELMKGLKDSFQTLHKALFKDLFALRDGPMTVARKAVQDAHQTLSKIPGVDGSTTTSTTSNQ